MENPFSSRQLNVKLANISESLERNSGPWEVRESARVIKTAQAFCCRYTCLLKKLFSEGHLLLMQNVEPPIGQILNHIWGLRSARGFYFNLCAYLYIQNWEKTRVIWIWHALSVFFKHKRTTLLQQLCLHFVLKNQTGGGLSGGTPLISALGK